MAEGALKINSSSPRGLGAAVAATTTAKKGGNGGQLITCYINIIKHDF